MINVFQDGVCHSKMAMVIDDRLKVWEDKDQPRVHVVPAFTPYYAPQAEVLNCVFTSLHSSISSFLVSSIDIFVSISLTDSKCRSCPLCSKKCCLQCQRLLLQVRTLDNF